MRDIQVGLVIRAVRKRRRMRQEDVAGEARVSQALVSRIERGDLGHTSVESLRRVAEAVGVSVELAPRWRGVELAKLLDERHAALVKAVTVRLKELGWDVRPELTFAIGDEKGSVDVMTRLERSGAVLVVEVKSVMPDLQATLATLDRKRRLAGSIARQLGWRWQVVGCVLVLPDEGQARNAVQRHGPVLDAALPARTVEVRRWLREPKGDLRGIWFLHSSTGSGPDRKSRGQIRVMARGGAAAVGRARSTSRAGARVDSRNGTAVGPEAGPRPPGVMLCGDGAMRGWQQSPE
jgi:transcriptional regulator with XRE-family HTH domain